MFRRQIRSAGMTAVGLRAISDYNFGQVKLTQEFASAKVAATPAKDSGVQVTKLPNGARVITHQRDGPQSSVGFYVDNAGAKFDPVATPGLSYVMRWALPTSNFENSLFQIDRAIRAGGATQEHTEVRKRFVGWKIEARPDSWAKPFENLASCIAVPRFPEYDIERFRDTMDNIREEQRFQQPRDYVADQVETVAYFKEPLGSPRMVPPEANSDCSSQALTDHWAKYFVPSNIVVAGINVNHAELCAAYENAPFPHSESAPHHLKAGEHTLTQKDEPVQYTGGEHHEPEKRAAVMGTSPDMASELVGALAFPVKGRASLGDYATSCVLQQLVDISLGDSLNTQRAQTIPGLRSFYRPFESSGLLGLTFFGAPEQGVSNAIAAGKVLKEVPITEDAVKVAIQRAAVAFYHSELEYQRDYLDFLGTSLNPKSETAVSAQNFLDAFSRVTVKHVKDLHASALSQPASLYATGETLGLPSLRQMGFN